jgi:hypothetical protein
MFFFMSKLIELNAIFSEDSTSADMTELSEDLILKPKRRQKQLKIIAMNPT